MISTRVVTVYHLNTHYHYTHLAQSNQITSRVRCTLVHVVVIAKASLHGNVTSAALTGRRWPQTPPLLWSCHRRQVALSSKLPRIPWPEIKTTGGDIQQASSRRSRIQNQGAFRDSTRLKTCYLPDKRLQKKKTSKRRTRPHQTRHQHEDLNALHRTYDPQHQNTQLQQTANHLSHCGVAPPSDPSAEPTCSPQHWFHSHERRDPAPAAHFGLYARVCDPSITPHDQRRQCFYLLPANYCCCLNYSDNYYVHCYELKTFTFTLLGVEKSSIFTMYNRTYIPHWSSSSIPQVFDITSSSEG